MSNLPEAQKLRLQAWAEQASSLGWIPASNVHALQEAALSNPGQLFEPSDRPLVAGLFGGTGVGKSTLLNRLAADAIAVASAERPTSRDITVYVHQSISVDNLPTSLPMQRMRTSLHRNEDYRNVMFIDMPDFDSVETANRELVDLWLPHLDVILYVVSPERYRDDKGWQLLKKHGSEHAWIFIINQWDRGVEQQRDDFVAQLAGQGLEQPMVFCTDCADARHALGSDLELATDDFAHLRQTLLNLSEQRIVTHLQELGVMARLATLKEMSDPWTEALGDEQLQLQLTTQWESHSEEHGAAIVDAVKWPINQSAQRYIDPTPFWRRLIGLSKRLPELSSHSLETLSQPVRDRLALSLNGFVNAQAHQRKLPLNIISKATQEAAEPVYAQSTQVLENSLNQSLISPGTPWQQRAHRLAGVLCLLLPIAALGWISFRVISGFASGANDTDAYLGSSFAVNAALLLGISWLLPALANAALQPAAQEAAERGLHNGVAQIIEQHQQAVNIALETLASQALDLRMQYANLWNTLALSSDTALPESVQRLLMTQIAQLPDRRLDVRANTHSSTDSAPLS